MRQCVNLGTCFVAALLIAGWSGVAQGDFIVDDFSAPDVIQVPVISLINPNPTLIEQLDPGIGGGERDLLLEVKGTARPGSFVGEIGAGNFLFASSAPGTTATLQYDAPDADIVGPPAALVNSEGLGGVDLTFGGTFNGISLDFITLDGGAVQTTGIEIEVHAGASVSTFAGAIPDAVVPTRYYVPYSAFSDPSVFTAVTSAEVRLNPAGVSDVDFDLDTILLTVPEPSTVAMLLSVAFLGCIVMLRRRRA